MFKSLTDHHIQEDTLDTPNELVIRHQQLCHRINDNVTVYPTAPGGPAIQTITSFHPTTLYGNPVPLQDINFHAQSPPSVTPLPLFDNSPDPSNPYSSPRLNMEDTVAAVSHRCRVIGMDQTQSIRMSFISVQGSNGSLVHGYHGLGGSWFIHGFLKIKNELPQRVFHVNQIFITLDVSCGGNAGPAHAPYRASLLAPQQLLLSNQFGIDNEVHFPFQFAMNGTYPQAFIGAYSRFRPYASFTLTATIHFTSYTHMSNGGFDSYKIQKLDTVNLEYNIPTPYFHRPAVMSLLSPPEPRSSTKNTQTKSWNARWTVTLDRGAVGKGDLIGVDVTLHGLQSSEPLTQITVELLEILGHKEPGQPPSPCLEQSTCAKKIYPIPSDQPPSIEVPYPISLVAPREVPQFKGAQPLTPHTPTKTCNADGEWSGYIVTHCIRVLLQGGKKKDRLHTFDFMEVPVVVFGCNRAGCNDLAERFPDVVGAMSGDVLGAALPAYNV